MQRGARELRVRRYSTTLCLTYYDYMLTIVDKKIDRNMFTGKLAVARDWPMQRDKHYVHQITNRFWSKLKSKEWLQSCYENL